MVWQFWLCLLSHLEETLGLWQQECPSQCSASPARGQQALLRPTAEPRSRALTSATVRQEFIPVMWEMEHLYTHTSRLGTFRPAQ